MGKGCMGYGKEDVVTVKSFRGEVAVISSQSVRVIKKKYRGVHWRCQVERADQSSK